jgi:hypothetical protein
MIKEQSFHLFVRKGTIGLTWDDLYGELTFLYLSTRWNCLRSENGSFINDRYFFRMPMLTLITDLNSWNRNVQR